MNKPVYLELVLTVRHCYLHDLVIAERLLLSGLENFKQNERIKNSFEFCFCRLEKPLELPDFFQPHLHCYVKAKPAYFEKGGFVSRKVLARIWRNSCALDYDPIISMRRLTGYFISQQEDKQ